jgi:hypothetical protein
MKSPGRRISIQVQNEFSCSWVEFSVILTERTERSKGAIVFGFILVIPVKGM